MKLFLECKPDEVLAMTLGVKRDEIVHSNDKGGVCRKLAAPNNKHMRGMIDEDPMSSQPGYLKKLSEVNRLYGILHMEDKVRRHTIAVLCPKLETWFLTECKRHRIDIKQYGLPVHADRLHEEINFKLNSFQRVIRLLIEKESPAVLRLQSLLIRR